MRPNLQIKPLSFRSHLYAEDLPQKDTITLPEAVAWLSGIEGADVQATVLCNPDERCKALLAGRNYKSAGFWQHVLSEIVADNEGRVGRWDWSTFEFVTDRKSPKSRSRQARNEQRLTELVESLIPRLGKSLFELRDLVTEVRRAETKRIWAIRSSLIDLVSNLERIASPDSLARLRLNNLESRSNTDRLHLSLCADGVFQRSDSRANPAGSVELWNRRPFFPPPKFLTGSIEFCRSSLIERFVSEPDRIRDVWINELLDQPYWGVAVAAIYLAEKGDLETVFRRVGHENETNHYVDSDTTIAALFGEPVASLSQLERLLRRGRVSAFGVRTGGSKAEPIPVPELLHMQFEILHSLRTIRLADRSGVSNLSWEHVSIKSCELMAHLPPKLPSGRDNAVSGLTHASSSVGAESRALKAAAEWVEAHEAQWTLSFGTIFDWIESESMPLSNNAKDRLKTLLAQKFDFLTRRGPRPKRRPPNWPHN